MTRVSAVVRAYNEEEHLGRLIHGLQGQTVPLDEIILVDSGSTDATVRIAEARGCRVVSIEKSEFSFGRSLNRGCAAARGDVLLILSAHVYPVYDTFVEHMLAPFESGAGIVYGRQIGDDRTKFSESRVMLKWFPEESIWDQGHPFSNNANAAVRRDLWSTLKYDEALTGLEDLEFAHRALGRGEKITYVAEAPVVHVHEEAWQVTRNRYRREAVAYHQIMGETKFSRTGAIGLAGANIVSDYWHAARQGQLLKNLAGIPKFRTAQFLGAVEGFGMARNVNQDLLRRFYYPTEIAQGGVQTTYGAPINYEEHEGR